MYPPQTDQLRVAIQGVKGSFHEVAARKFFGDDIELDMCYTFPALFQSLAEAKSQAGILAIENTVAGTLLPNYALLRNSDCTVIGEVYLRIEHCLMALPGQQIEDIREVHSHPMALQQCQVFLNKYTHWRLVEAADTAASAAEIQEKNWKGIAAVGSVLAAEAYGLDVLQAGIETNKENFTRFLILLPRSTEGWQAQRADKASVCFHLRHSVGSLAQILLVLSSHGMNLTKIQSLPIVGQAWEYFFHLDLEFEDYEQYLRALAAIQPLVAELKVLGEYPRGLKPTNE